MISVQIEYPQQLVDQVEAAIKDRPLMGFVPGAGPNHPAVMLVGEAPGRSETDSRVPFSGTSGKELIKLLEKNWFVAGDRPHHLGGPQAAVLG